MTDDDILETAQMLATSLDLDEDGRNEIAFRIQRLVWPPVSWPFLHENEHAPLEISEDGRSGLLTCGGCGRRWRVNQAPNRNAVYEALMAAHREYRTGVLRSIPVRSFPSRVTGQMLPTFETLLGGGYADIEVQDERWTG